jgi:hypothetical protein
LLTFPRNLHPGLMRMLGQLSIGERKDLDPADVHLNRRRRLPGFGGVGVA